MIPEGSVRCRSGPNRTPNGLLSAIQSPIRTRAFTEDYTVVPGAELGRGKFSVVKKCVEKSTGHKFAAKFMRKRRKGQDCRREIIHEIAVLELATANPRVVHLHQVYEMASEMVLVLEYAAGGEIFNLCVSEDEAFGEDDVRRIMRQILEGVDFLHQNNVVHLDLKPQNILLTSSSPLGDVKLIDFGLSRMVSRHQELREIMGTPEYVAPEILNYEPISTATDMWSLGVLTYMMLTGISPFLGDDKLETFLNISQLNVSYSREEVKHLDEEALTFMKMLLRKQPQERATAEQCLQHPWLQKKETTMVKEISAVEEEQTGMNSSTQPETFTGAIMTTSHQVEAAEEGNVKVERPAIEELMVMAAFTLGQCRHSPTSGTDLLSLEQKAVSKRLKFEEAFSAAVL